MSVKQKPQRDLAKESAGWFHITLIMLLFPALFFLCVFFPIWVGWTQRFP